MSRAILAIVHGRVQGVGFRYAARRVAVSSGLTGWVRNLPTGDVEVFAQGDPEVVEGFASWLRTGPPGAWVEEVDVAPREPSDDLRTFEVRG